MKVRSRRTSDTPRAGWWIAWLLLALFIVAGSAGTWAAQPGIWAPLLVTPGDAARNMLVYVPFGVIAMFALGRSDARGVARVTAIAILFSVTTEALQIYTIDRVASVTDVLWAAVGTFVGALGVFCWPPR